MSDLQKKSEEIRRTVLTNILKMINTRGLINENTLNKYINLFVNKKNENDIYEIRLDTEINPQRENINNLNFIKNKIIVKLMLIDIKGLKHQSINDFIDTHKDNHKIFIFKNISDKPFNLLLEYPNVEVFNESYFMINLLDYVGSPKYEILNDEECEELLTSLNVQRNQLPQILSFDPVSRYFNLRKGQILKIIRPSPQTIESVAYRIVINSDIKTFN